MYEVNNNLLFDLMYNADERRSASIIKCHVDNSIFKEARSALVVIGCRTEAASPKEDYAFSSCLPILNFNGQTTQFTIRSQTAVYNHLGLLFSLRHPQNTAKQ